MPQSSSLVYFCFCSFVCLLSIGIGIGQYLGCIMWIAQGPHLSMENELYYIFMNLPIDWNLSTDVWQCISFSLFYPTQGQGPDSWPCENGPPCECRRRHGGRWSIRCPYLGSMQLNFCWVHQSWFNVVSGYSSYRYKDNACLTKFIPITHSRSDAVAISDGQLVVNLHLAAAHPRAVVTLNRAIGQSMPDCLDGQGWFCNWKTPGPGPSPSHILSCLHGTTTRTKTKTLS